MVVLVTAVEVKAWVSNYIQQNILDDIACPCRNLKYLINGTPDVAILVIS